MALPAFHYPVPCHSAAAGHCGGKHDLPERGQSRARHLSGLLPSGRVLHPAHPHPAPARWALGVEICQPIADALTFIVSLPFLLAFLNQLDRMDDAEKAKAQS